MRGDHLLLKLRLVVGSLICVVVGATTAAPYYAGSYHAAAAAAPSPGSIHKVVQQAHNLQLIPQHAVVDKTAPSIQVAAYSVGPAGKTDLQSALGSSIPWDVVRSLEKQVDSIGETYYSTAPVGGASSSSSPVGSHQNRRPLQPHYYY